MRTAIIDLGTNTFNLLIADVNGNAVDFVYKAKMPSKLGENGINRSYIHEDAFIRGINIIREYKKIIKKHGVNQIQAIATSAVRSATNGPEFIQEILNETGISVQIISGEKEAELIFNGVSNSVDEDSYLILDIGGGSTEFILVENNQIKLLKSFQLGMARLMERFSPSEPITNEEIWKIESFLKHELKDFFEEIKSYRIRTLVGSSGSFDTILSMTAHQFYKSGHFKKNLSSTIEKEHFNYLYKVIIQTNLVERREIPGMDLVRVEMMVLAMIFTNFVMQELGINKLVQSRYALKEGIC
jgi:exopolyphosphatase/guanosine-5'-triphosphate,3'-diphosphate pyrophosphatase